MKFADLNDKWYIVILAYIAAFLPWTAFGAKDFISAEWKTVRHTRIAGYINLFCSCIPALYILFYFATQFAASDWKEGSAAVVALMFALLHAARTAWGLWQLHIFHSWSAQSIDALRLMAVSFNFTDSERRHLSQQKSSSWDLADELLVNSSIIDNQLFHGDVKSFVRYADRVDLRSPPPAPHATWSETAMLLWNYIALWSRAIFCCALMMLDGARFLVGASTSGKLRQLPKEPAEVWVNWAVAFAAQGLQSWMSDFNVSMHPNANEVGTKSRKSLADWQRRASYYASEVLSASIMQLWPEVEAGSSNLEETMGPIIWSGWNEKSMVHSGKLVNKELLEQAMRSGQGLPFGASHDELLQLEEGRGDQKGYNAYSRHLASKVARLDVRKEFCSEIEMLDVNKLECLTILLYLGTRSLKLKLGDKVLRAEPSEDEADVNREGNGSHCRMCDRCSNASESGNETFDQALDNLRKQLSLPLKAEARFEEHETDSKQVVPSLPFSNRWTHARSRSRHVLQVGEVVDIWLALVAGDGIKFMLTLKNKWAKVFNGTSSERVEVENDEGDNIKEMKATCDSGRNEDTSVAHLQGFQRTLEKARLRYQFGDENCICDWGMNFGMTFMGYRMEVVRSYLAEWAYRMRNESESGERVTSLASRFRSCVEDEKGTGFGAVNKRIVLSEALSGSLECGDRGATLRSRQFHIRLLWELQEHFESETESWMGCCEKYAIPKHGPESLSLIALCMLSFPSLSVEMQHKSVARPDVVTKSGEWYGIQIEGHSGGETDARPTNDGVEEVELVIEPVCGPQKGQIRLRFELSEDDARMSAIVSVGLEEDNEFVWEWWRDTFIGRLEGMKEWQEDHYMQCSLGVVPSAGCMNAELQGYRTVTDEIFEVWKGWKPFRAEICMFEMKRNSLLRSSQPIRNLSPTGVRVLHDNVTRSFGFLKQTNTVVSYKEAESAVVLNAMSMIRDSISRDWRINENGEQAGLQDHSSKQNLIAMAEQFCTGDVVDVERALLLFETAVAEPGNVDALKKGVAFILGNGRISDARATQLVYKFVSHIVPSGVVSGSILATEEYEELKGVVLDSCKKLALRGNVPAIDFRLYNTIVFLSAYGNKKEHEEIRTLFEVLLCRCETYEAVSEYYTYYYTAFGTVQTLEKKQNREQLTEIISERGDADGLEQDWPFVLRLFQRVTKNHPCANTAISMALLWQCGADGVAADAVRAQRLYERAIEEGGHVNAMNNLALLLEEGADGVAADAVRAQRLYERAIEEAADGDAM